MRPHALALVITLACTFLGNAAEAGSRYVVRAYSGPRLSYYHSRSVFNPLGPGHFVARSSYVARTPYFVSGPVYGGPAASPFVPGYTFTPYYYPVMPVPVAPAQVVIEHYGW